MTTTSYKQAPAKCFAPPGQRSVQSHVLKTFSPSGAKTRRANIKVNRLLTIMIIRKDQRGQTFLKTRTVGYCPESLNFTIHKIGSQRQTFLKTKNKQAIAPK